MMRPDRIIRSVSGGVMLLAALGLMNSTARAQNVLANPGFETGTSVGGAEQPGSAGWSTFGNTFTESAPSPAPIGPHTGTGDLKEFGTFPGVSGAFQQFNTSPGDVWTFTGFGANASSDPMQTGNFGELKISFHNAGGEILGVDGNHIDVNTPSNIWTPLSAVGTAPAGTTFVQLFELFVQPQFAGGSAFFDDVSATVVPVPEPATIGLISIGGLMSLRRRRR